tara:strand:+ start:20 stop:469 length:450 start_codon:yes stop_codon:yes gene_type:complete
MKLGSASFTIGGAFAGIITGSAITFGGQAIAHKVYPPPDAMKLMEGENYDDHAARIAPLMAEYISQLPIGAFVAILVAYFLGAIGGGAVAGKIARGNQQAVFVACGLLLMAGVMNLVNTPHPMWFNVAVPVVYALGTAVAIRLIPSTGR